MKFTKLSAEFDKIVKKHKKGKKIKPKIVKKLVQKLTERRLGYEKKLNSNLSKEERKSYKTKLKVVKAHIAKSKKLL